MVRHATKDDIPKIIELYKQEHWAKEGYDPDFLSNNPNVHLLVNDIDGKIVATAQLDIINTLAFGPQPYGAIEFVVTDKNERRHGYMRQIFEEIDNICEQYNCESVMLTSTITRMEAHHFYENMGYVAAVKGFRKEYPEKIITKREANRRIYKKLLEEENKSKNN